MVNGAEEVIVKLVAFTRADTPNKAGSVALHVTPSLVPKDESKVRMIWLSFETAVVFTVTVVAEAATTTAPADKAEQTAGDADEEQVEAVPHFPLDLIAREPSSIFNVRPFLKNPAAVR